MVSIHADNALGIFCSSLVKKPLCSSSVPVGMWRDT